AVGGEIQLTATATTSPVNARGKLTLTSLDLEPVSPYLSQFAHLRLSQGTVSAGITAGYGRDTEDAALVHAAGSLVISNLAAVDMGMATDFIRWDTVELNDFKAGMQPNRVELGELVVRGVQTSLIIHDNGQINVLR